MGASGLPDLPKVLPDWGRWAVGDPEALRAARTTHAGPRVPERAVHLAHRAGVRRETRQGSGGHRAVPRDELPATYAGPRRSGQQGRGATRLRALQKPPLGGTRRSPIATDRGRVSRRSENVISPSE